MAKELLFIFNDPPYGSEKIYNALRLALALVKKQEGGALRIFLLGDAVLAAKKSQNVVLGYYNLEIMLKSLLAKRVTVSACGTCMNARGMTDEELIDGINRGTMDLLSDWTLWAGNILVF